MCYRAHFASIVLSVAVAYDVRFCRLQFGRSSTVINSKSLEFKGRTHMLSNRHFAYKVNQKSFDCLSNQCQSSHLNVKATSEQCLDLETFPQESQDGDAFLTSPNGSDFDTWKPRSQKFMNRFLNLVRLRSVLNNAAESFFKSEIRRRLFVTAVLIVISRVGYFIPLPGFDRRLIPQDYLSFVSGSVGEFNKITIHALVIYITYSYYFRIQFHFRLSAWVILIVFYYMFM